mmetsp:Transcript_50460/g.64665  ORF Transcript_50460/g.64665 Transcript_50460/m.64665 type:complete len:744 (+) Transcript_50460:66-2297(+)
MASSIVEYEGKDLPSIGHLLVSIDSAARTDQEALKNTLKALLKRAEVDGVTPQEYLKLALLVAFRRRNHLKSMAQGVGGGERLILLTILHAVSIIAPELVIRVLPLVPMYGSWRDVRLLGDMVFEKEPTPMKQQVRKAVSTLFASQLRRDMEAANLGMDGQPLETKNEKKTISLACKYAPSSSRHRGSKRTRDNSKEQERSMVAKIAIGHGRGLGGRGPGRILGKGGKGGRGKGGRGKGFGGKGSIFSPEAAAESREDNHASQSAMADEVSAALGLRKTHLKADLRKNVISPLNNLLTEDGYLIERLLVERRCSEIKFRRAGKTALEKYKNTINSDPVAARRWKAIMETSSTAIPDINDLYKASQSFLDSLSYGSGNDDDEVIMNQRSISKAIDNIVEDRNRLCKKAEILLSQLSKEDNINNAIQDAKLALENVEVLCLPLVDLGTCNSVQHGVAMLLSAFITMRAQERQGMIPLGNGDICIHFHNNKQVLINLPCSQEEEVTEISSQKMEEDGAAAEHKPSTEPASRRVDGIDFANFYHLVEAEGLICDSGNSPLTIESLTTCSNLLLNQNKKVDGDILVLCGDFDTVATDANILEECISNLKQKKNMKNQEGQGQLRALLVHRVKPCLRTRDGQSGEGIEIPYKPRRLRPFPSNMKDLEVDICFLMDLTASMGSSWIDACKTHLKNIINELKSETNVGEFRISFVGYRDYRDTNRIVSINFHSMKNVDKKGNHPSIKYVHV